ncbi:MAG: acyl carrier protein [Lachnospiraceae bacterium]|nr:acyl carrier protein [Lachnospiraceae bacterium]
MTRKEIFQKVLKTVRDCIPDLDISEMTEQTVISETGMNSMAFLMIICQLEANLDIQIPESEWPTLLTIGDVVSSIESKQQAS